MDDDNVYRSLTAASADGDARWAFGTGFDAPLLGVPMDFFYDSDAAKEDLAIYATMLGDDALVMAQRLIQWCTRAPELEEEVALANIALDLLGQARLLLARAGQAEGKGRDEDALAYLRDPEEFRNVHLVELPNGDFATSIARLLVFSTYRLALLDRLTASHDPVLAAVAAKGVKEVTYHRDYAARWTVRLGDGTRLSHDRMRQGLAVIRPYVAPLFRPHEIETRLATTGIAVNPATLRDEFDTVIAQTLTAATLPPGLLHPSPANIKPTATPQAVPAHSPEPAPTDSAAAATAHPAPDPGPTQSAREDAKAADPGPATEPPPLPPPADPNHPDPATVASATTPRSVPAHPTEPTPTDSEAAATQDPDAFHPAEPVRADSEDVSAEGAVGVVGDNGRGGVHTPALAPLLAELQRVARATPGATW